MVTYTMAYKEVIAEHQRKHGKNEEIQIGEETPVGWIIAHIADGVDVDQRSHEAHHAGHQPREGIELKTEGNLD